MNIILIILLFLLMIYIDIKRGIKLFLSILFNFIILMIIFYCCWIKPYNLFFNRLLYNKLYNTILCK